MPFFNFRSWHWTKEDPFSIGPPHSNADAVFSLYCASVIGEYHQRTETEKSILNLGQTRKHPDWWLTTTARPLSRWITTGFKYSRTPKEKKKILLPAVFNHCVRQSGPRMTCSPIARSFVRSNLEQREKQLFSHPIEIIREEVIFISLWSASPTRINCWPPRERRDNKKGFTHTNPGIFFIFLPTA